jgi:6-phosphogluconolactonase
MQTRWHPSDSDPAWLAAALDFVARAEREALAARGEFHIVLAGGNTPRLVYEALAREPHDWPRWQVWFGDERCLPAEHPERNSVMARAALLDRVPLAAVHASVHFIPGELGAQAAAAAYAEELAGVPAFDLVLLGLGEDGHTASLFPGHAGAQEADAVAVFNAPKPPRERVSLSASRLSRARHVLFLVSGAGKRHALRRWRAGEPAFATIPAVAIQPEAGVDVLLGPDLSLPGVLS